MARNWTPEERKKQSELTKRQKPWQHSTGPKTKSGKEIAKYNGVKHGMRSAEAEELRHLLFRQKCYVRALLKRIEKQ